MITAKEAKIVSESILSVKSQETIKIIDKLIREAANRGKKSIIVSDVSSESIKLYLESNGYEVEVVTTSYNTPAFLKVSW